MIIELKLRLQDGCATIHSDDLPGLHVFGTSLEDVMADFPNIWRKMHEIAPTQVMPVPKCHGDSMSAGRNKNAKSKVRKQQRKKARQRKAEKK